MLLTYIPMQETEWGVYAHRPITIIFEFLVDPTAHVLCKTVGRSLKETNAPMETLLWVRRKEWHDNLYWVSHGDSCSPALCSLYWDANSIVFISILLWLAWACVNSMSPSLFHFLFSSVLLSWPICEEEGSQTCDQVQVLREKVSMDWCSCWVGGPFDQMPVWGENLPGLQSWCCQQQGM